MFSGLQVCKIADKAKRKQFTRWQSYMNLLYKFLLMKLQLWHIFHCFWYFSITNKPKLKKLLNSFVRHFWSFWSQSWNFTILSLYWSKDLFCSKLKTFYLFLEKISSTSLSYCFVNSPSYFLHHFFFQKKDSEKAFANYRELDWGDGFF